MSQVWQFRFQGQAPPCKPSRRGALTPAQARALDDLGFNWDPDEERWETAFAQLRAFRHEHGHADPPLRYVTPGGLQLGQWLSTNRRGYHAGTLAPSRAAALDQLGVTWDLAAAAWEHNRQHLAGYVTEHGHARVPQHYTAPDGCPSAAGYPASGPAATTWAATATR